MKTRFEDRIVFFTGALNKHLDKIQAYGRQNLILKAEITWYDLLKPVENWKTEYKDLPKQDDEGNWIPRSIELWKAGVTSAQACSIRIVLSTKDTSHQWEIGILRNNFWLDWMDRRTIRNWMPLSGKTYGDKTRAIISQRMRGMADAWKELANNGQAVDKEELVEYLHRARLLEYVAGIWNKEEDDEEGEE